MNKRARKKWLKQHGKYVAPKELWNLDCRIAEFVLPRLRKFREVEDGCPGCGEMDTHEKWMAALDKMILAFEYVLIRATGGLMIPNMIILTVYICMARRSKAANLNA